MGARCVWPLLKRRKPWTTTSHLFTPKSSITTVLCLTAPTKRTLSSISRLTCRSDKITQFISFPFKPAFFRHMSVNLHFWFCRKFKLVPWVLSFYLSFWGDVYMYRVKIIRSPVKNTSNLGIFQKVQKYQRATMQSKTLWCDWEASKKHYYWLEEMQQLWNMPKIRECAQL